jgi:hypothetical protein
MSEESKMPMDWALADSANRLSVACMVKMCTNINRENPLFSLGKHLVKFPIGTVGTFPSFQLGITSELLIKLV